MSTTSARTFDIGDQPTFVWTFRDEDGVLTSPVAIQFSQLAPNGTQTDEAIGAATEESVGVFSWTIPAPFNAPGTWKFRAAATAGIVSAEELSVKVRKTSFT